jgi:hypothetical protein
VTEQLRTSEWAMVCSLGNDSLRRIIAACHRLRTPAEVVPMTVAYNERIRDSCSRTQNHHKGLDRFIRKSDPEVEMSATVTV